jgi:hypothetical protein
MLSGSEQAYHIGTAYAASPIEKEYIQDLSICGLGCKCCHPYVPVLVNAADLHAGGTGTLLHNYDISTGSVVELMFNMQVHGGTHSSRSSKNPNDPCAGGCTVLLVIYLHDPCALCRWWHSSTCNLSP